MGNLFIKSDKDEGMLSEEVINKLKPEGQERTHHIQIQIRERDGMDTPGRENSMWGKDP